MAKDNNPRELIGTVTLTSGDQVEVRMPIMADMLNQSAINRLPFEVMIEAATGMPFAEFKKLSITDGTSILLMLTSAMEAMNKYLSNMSVDINTKKH